MCLFPPLDTERSEFVAKGIRKGWTEARADAVFEQMQVRRKRPIGASGNLDALYRHGLIAREKMYLEQVGASNRYADALTR